MTQEKAKPNRPAARGAARHQSAFIARDNQADYLSPASVVPGDESFTRGNSDYRSDNIVDALKEGASEIKDRAGNHIGFMNSREELLLDIEHRKLLDVVPHRLSREEILANILRRECADMTPEEQYNLALLDKNIDPAVIKPMLIEEKPAPKVVPQEPPREEVVSKMADDALTGAIHAAAVAQVSKIIKQENKNSIFLPGFKERTVIEYPKVQEPEEKMVQLKCSVGCFQLPVLDVLVEEEYVVIIQKKDAAFLFEPERDGREHYLDIIDAALVYSGISYEFGNARHTIMVIRRNR